MKFPFIKQFDSMDCGPSCLGMVVRHYGKFIPIETLREKCFLSREGVSALGISDAAESIGLRTLSANIPFDNFVKDMPLPAIAHWKQNHFVVVYKTTKKRIYVADPAFGLIDYDYNEFKASWLSSKHNGVDTGLVLVLEPTADFYNLDNGGDNAGKTSTGFFLNYLKPHRKSFVHVLIGVLVTSILMLILPFLSQSVVDIGIQNQDIGFINLILVSQLLLQTGSLFVDFIKSRLLLHIGGRISISLLSDFIQKLMKLPFEYYDNKTRGDLMQRMADHRRIQEFLTSSSVSFFFTVVNLIVFGLVLGYYNFSIFLVFLSGSVLYILWILLFMRRRKTLDQKMFHKTSESQNKIIQILEGLQEIKLQNSEQKKRWEFERVQVQQYKVTIEALNLMQLQQAGSFFIDQTKNIFISFLAAKAVISGDITLGMMLSISFIVGQLNAPIYKLLDIILSWQNAKISLGRMTEIFDKPDEPGKDPGLVNHLPAEGTVHIKNLSFSYHGPRARKVLDNVNLTIPEGKITAIVGHSGSGKTTLVKLLLNMYNPTEGAILVGDTDLRNINAAFWRSKCNAVLQDSYIFSDTIANNIGISDERIDKERFTKAISAANVDEFVQKLPLLYNTKVGKDGNGLSMGQRQRLLIARAIYKEPAYLFLDEATNSLDADNEQLIMNNLNTFFQGRTVVIVAHRLSTVMNADQIVLLSEGRIKEIGTHAELVAKKGAYYQLIRQQLSLGE
jgi:ATP-binding cassette, subfamily B, bacterial